MAGERDQAYREKDLLAEERNQVMKKCDEFKDMTIAATKAKELAVAEVRKFILKSDEQQRAIQKLDTRVKDVEKLNQDLVLVNKSQKDMIADLQEGLVTTTEEVKAEMTEMEFDFSKIESSRAKRGRGFTM